MRKRIITPSEHEAALIIHRATLLDRPWVQHVVSSTYIICCASSLINDHLFAVGKLLRVVAILCMFLSVPLLVALHYRNLIRILAQVYHINIPLDRDRLLEQRRIFLFRAVIVLLPAVLLILLLYTN